MKRLLLLLALCLVVAVPASALIETFQDLGDEIGVSVGAGSGGGGGGYYIYDTRILNSDRGDIMKYSYITSISGRWQNLYYINSVPTTFTYAAFDVPYYDYVHYPWNDPYFTISLLDSTGANMGTSSQFIPVSGSRYEVKIVGGTPTLYKDGVSFSTMGAVSTNPSYLYINVYLWSSPYNGQYTNTATIDNFVIGESDKHCIGAPPSNWTLNRDLITPASNGVYATNPDGSQTLKNSNTFYADADKEGLTVETLYIKRVSDGTIIDTQILTAPHNQIAYNLAQFLNNATTDGQYSICWDGSTNCGYLNVVSGGAAISFDQSTYNIGDTATLSYTITPLYYDTTTYDYSYKIVDIYGTTKSSGVVSNTGTISVPLTSPTYTAGVYYAEIVATKKSDLTTSIMAYDSMTLSDYVVIAGDVIDAQTTLPLVGANVNVTQALTTQTLTSGFDGNYTTTSTFLTGGSLNINATKTGYKQYLYTFTPLSSGTKTVTISLEPETPTYTGVAIGGVVRDSQYGNPIVGVTAYVMNGTTYQNITNSAGWYQVDNLVVNTLYDVWSSGLGYSNSTVHQVLAVGV